MGDGIVKLEFESLECGPVVQAPLQAPLQAGRQDAPHETGAVPPLQFDLPRSVLMQLAAASLSYLVLMGLAFRAGTGIGLLFAVFGIVLVGYYGLPLVMARSSGATREAIDDRRGAWGIDTASGYLPGRAAWAQIMTVPLLMLARAVLLAFIR